MENERPIALALLTQSQLDMLGGSLKIVFRVEDNAEGFADLLRALDEADQLAGENGPPTVS
jgi:hypothetical protein